MPPSPFHVPTRPPSGTATANDWNRNLRFRGSQFLTFLERVPGSLVKTLSQHAVLGLVLQRPILKLTSQPARLVPKKQGAESC